MRRSPALDDLDDRSREVFRRVVEGYLDTGEPVGSRTLTRAMPVSAATIRNVMQDLEWLGLLEAPHVSAGRMPTEAGLRLFVDGLLEVRDLDDGDRDAIEATGGGGGDVPALMTRVGDALSTLTQGASLVLAPRQEAPIKHIEFVSLGDGRTLVVMVLADGRVENRVFTPPPGTTPSAMREAANLMNAIAEGRTLGELRGVAESEVAARRREIDALAAGLIEKGLATWSDEGTEAARLIVRGRANLIGQNAADMDRVRALFDDLERKRDVVDLLAGAETAEGVRVFIGSENRLFSLTGSSLVVSPYMDADRRIVGAVGVIGPTRLNYGRVVPIVDYTAQLVGRLLGGRSKG